MSNGETFRDVLEEHNIDPSRERGQHFLHNDLVIDRMVSGAQITEEDTVLEIGAGIGNITRQLAEKAYKVVAYENDNRLLTALKERTEEFGNVEIVDKDFFHDETPRFVDKCVSNIPFHLSSDIVTHLGEEQLMSVLIVQKAFAKKLIARPGTDDYSKLSIRVQYDFTPTLLETVYDFNFFPQPETDAAMVKLYPNRGKVQARDEEFFFHTVNALFSQRSKKVRNAFYNTRYMFDLEKDDAKMLQDQIPHSEERVENLNVKELAEIGNMLDEILD